MSELMRLSKKVDGTKLEDLIAADEVIIGSPTIMANVYQNQGFHQQFNKDSRKTGRPKDSSRM